MDLHQPAPTSLKIVAGLFIFSGVCSVIELVVSLMHNCIEISPGVLGVFIGSGPLRFRRGWRTCAIAFLWMALISFPMVALLIMAHHGPFDFKVFGQKVGYASKGSFLTISALFFVLTLWQYRVLTRPDIRRLFGIDNG